MFRNKEFKIYITFLVVILIAGTSACFYFNITAGIIALVSFFLITCISLIYTKWRYKQIGELSLYLKRIVGGDYSLDIRDNDEGELSILKSEIYKVTVTLYEQASLLQKDKHFLANAISDISHQLKTPITSMFVMADLISDESLPQNKRIEFTNNIHSQLERLQWLVSSLLKLSKIDAGAVDFKKENINVKELINKSIEHLLIPMDIKEQNLEISGDKHIEITGDFNWLAEALANIIKNCIEHTPCGGKIKASFSETSIYTIIKINDNGKGILKKDLPHIFTRFYKGKNAHNDSIGIGLAMSKSILENHSATIEVISEKDVGTEFIIKFYKNII